MLNYQLYRTNVLLGGQMKYDLILKSASTELVVDDFHITPISNKVPYNKYIKDNLLNYSHNDNISRYYKAVSGSFYKDFVDTELTDLYPLISETKKNYDDTYEMGCRRMNYELYNKQFSYLCPIWLEQLKENECLMFEFNLYTTPEQTKSFSTKSLYIDDFNSNILNVKYHNKFVNYFNNYLTYIECHNGNDWVLDIKEDGSLINGVNVETGANKTAKLHFIYQNLTSRERPLLEQNNMLINEISNNKLITKQLFNFNFCFNLIDLCKWQSSYQLLNNQLRGKNLYVDVNVYICDKQTKNIISKLEHRDLFSNHDYIKKHCCNPTKIKLKYVGNEIEIDNSINIEHRDQYINPNDELNEINVLSYLQDYNCIDLIDKNKIIQNTIHWSTVNSPEITFNFYNGFSGYLSNERDLIMLKDVNAYTPNVDIETYSDSINQYWCNSIELKNDYPKDDDLYIPTTNIFINFVKNIINTPSKYIDLFSKFNKNCTVKNINYTYTNIDVEDANIYTLILDNKLDFHIKDNIVNNVNIKYEQFDDSNSGVYMIIDKKDPNNIKNYLIFIYNDDKTYIPLIKVKNALNNFIKKSEELPYDTNLSDICKYVNLFINIIDNKAAVNHVYTVFPSGLNAYIINGPSLSVKEFEYFKNNVSKFIERDIGKIKPTFIKIDSENFFNFKFSKLNLNDVKYIPKYLNYQKLGFPAKYPSIGYYPFKKEVQQYTPNDTSSDKYEYNIFHYNKLLNLSDDISSIFIVHREEDNTYKSLENIIYNHIKNTYNINDDILVQYILSLYNYTYDFEYESDNWDPSKGPNYKYNVKIKLK